MDRVADLLLARGTYDDQALAADLLAEAGETDRATSDHAPAGAADIARGALRAAEDLLDRAAARGAAAADLAIGPDPASNPAGSRAEALQEGVPRPGHRDGDDHAELCLELARAAVVAGRWQQARRLVERAGRPDDPRSLVLNAEASFGAGDVERATAARSDAAVAAAESVGSPELLCAALIVAARCATLISRQRARAHFNRAAQCCRRVRARPLAGRGAVRAGPDRSHRRPADRRHSLEARELALDAGLLTQVVSIDVITTRADDDRRRSSGS